MTQNNTTAATLGEIVMSTCASIRFTDGHETYYLRRGHDGVPEVVLPDIAETIAATSGNWSGPEVAQLVAQFLARTYRKGARLHEYEPFTGVHPDAAYIFEVAWNREIGGWTADWICEAEP